MVYRFGEFVLDDVTREIDRRGRRLSVEPKVFDFLCLLLRHRSRVLPRSLLLQEIWSGVAVSDASLGRLVKEARRAVGDSGSRQEVIRTLRGSGYRFVADVVVEGVQIGGGVERAADRLISHARASLESAMDRGSRELRSHVEEFVRTCQIAIASVREESE